MPCFATTTTMNYLNDRPSFHYSPKKNRGKLTFFSQQPRTFITEAGHHTTKLKLLLSPTNLVFPTTKNLSAWKLPVDYGKLTATIVEAVSRRLHRPCLFPLFWTSLLWESRFWHKPTAWRIGCLDKLGVWQSWLFWVDSLSWVVKCLKCPWRWWYLNFLLNTRRIQ